MDCIEVTGKLALSGCAEGGEISDLVRLSTISDIFAALIESRPYRPAMSSQDAHRVLSEMDGKLERPLVKAFQKVALVARLMPGANVAKV
jgi:HD-GYP domain-containing protein (c-di-GMP phosphodiesterase class II)